MFFAAKGKINRLAVVIVALMAILIVTGLIALHNYRCEKQAHEMLLTGQKYYDQNDWQNASLYFKRYLTRYPQDIKILSLYAKSQLEIHPGNQATLSAAIGAYRRLIRLSPNDPEPYRKLATLYISIGNYSELSYIAKRRLSFVPDDYQASLWLAISYIKDHQSDEARSLLTQIVSEIPATGKNSDIFCECTLLLSGLDSQSSDELVRRNAVTWADQAVWRYPDNVKSYYYRARYNLSATFPNQQIRQQRISSALDDLDIAGDLNPNVQLTLQICQKWLALGYLGKAEKLFAKLENVNTQKIKESFPDENNFYMARYFFAVTLAMRKHALSEALNYATEILEHLKNEEYRRIILPSAVKVFAVAKQTKQAKAYLDEYIQSFDVNRIDPEITEQILLLNAHIDNAEGNLQKLISRLEPVALRYPKNIEMLVLLANAFMQTNQHKRAIDLLEQVNLTHQNVTLILTLSELYQRESDFESADKYLQLALENEPNGEVLLKRAWLMFTQQKYKQAEQIYRELLTAHPNNLNALNNLAWILANVRNDQDRAIVLINKAINLSPQMYDLFDTRAEIFVMLGQLREARIDYEKYFQHISLQSPKSALIASKLGELCLELNDKPYARYYFQQAIEIDRQLVCLPDADREKIKNLLKTMPESFD